MRLPGLLNVSLRAKLAALLIVASVLPLGISAFVDIREIRQQRINDAQALLTARADQVARELDSVHQSYQRSTVRVANLPAVRTYCEAAEPERAVHRERVQGIFATFSKSDSAILGMALIDTSGHVAVASDPSLPGVDLSARPVVLEALQGKSVISSLAFAPWKGELQPAVAYMVPVRNAANEIICVIAMGLRADIFSGVLRAAHNQAGPESFAVLTDQWGIRIALSTESSMLYHPGGPLEPAVIDAQVTQGRFGPKTRELLESVHAFPEQFERSRAVSPEKNMFLGWAPVNKAMNYGVAHRLTSVPWTVFYMVPEADLLNALSNATREKVLLALGIMAVAAGLGLAFAASILRPVQELADATAALAAGDTSARVPAHGNDELGKLAASFNTMAAQIQTQADDLRHSRDELSIHAHELEMANKDLEAFASSVSHDLRAPLHVVDGFSKLLSTKLAGQLDDKTQHYLNRIRAGVALMEQLVEALLRLSRLGRQALDKKIVNVADLVDEVLVHLRNENVLRDDRVQVRGELPAAMADRILLQQVFTNLLSNACKFTADKPQPEIVVGCEARQGQQVYFVRDNGAGFDPARASKLFEPFQRMHESRDFAGLGIGLSIVKRIVQRHGGQIWFDAEAGKGACFYFTLEAALAADSAST
ncbi:MAG: ATP-binding protein [Pseudomonadota bacterium]